MNAHQLWKITANPIDPDRRIRYKQLTQRRQKRFVKPPTRKESCKDISTIKIKRKSQQPIHFQRSHYSAFGAKTISHSNTNTDTNTISNDINEINETNKKQVTNRIRPQSAYTRAQSSKKQFKQSQHESHVFDFVRAKPENIKSEPLVNIETGTLYASKRTLLHDRKTDTVLMRTKQYEKDGDMDRPKKRMPIKTNSVVTQNQVSSLIKNEKKNQHCKPKMQSKQYPRTQHQSSLNIFKTEIQPTPPQPSRHTFNTIFNME